MNINEKKIYMRANELYKEGKIAEAIKLWSTINQSKKSVLDIEPLIWKFKNLNYFLDIRISVYVMYSCLILLSNSTENATFLDCNIFLANRTSN